MHISHARLALGIPLAAGALAIVAAATPAVAAPPSDGCPAGYSVLSVAVLSAAGYQVPAAVDSATSGIRSFGQPGNGNGLVCGVKLGNQLTPWGDPIYNFLDDQLPA